MLPDREQDKNVKSNFKPADAYLQDESLPQVRWYVCRAFPKHSCNCPHCGGWLKDCGGHVTPQIPRDTQWRRRMTVLSTLILISSFIQHPEREWGRA